MSATQSTNEITRYSIDDPEYPERRRITIGASDIAATAGVHPYKTIARLTAQKRGLAGLDPDPDSALIRRGHALEDDAIDEIKKLPQCATWVIERSRDQYVDWTDRISCSPDAYVHDHVRGGVGVLQIKVVTASKFRESWTEDTPPLGYLLQLAQEMMLVPDCTWGAIGALVIGEFQFDAHVYPLDRNIGAEKRLRTLAAEFWRAFDAGDHPAINFERDGDLIALMFPQEIKGKVVDLSTDNAIGDLLERREILRGVAKDTEKRLAACETEIKAKLGDAEGALVPGWKVTLKTQHREEFVSRATSFRVLRAKRLEQQSAG